MYNIEVVSFDIEGTLVDHSLSNLIWETDIPEIFAEMHGLDLETARRHVIGEYQQIGDEQLEWYDIGYWFRRLGLSGDWLELLERRRQTVEIYPETREVLNKVYDKYTLIVISNTIREFIEIQLKDLKQFFEHVFSAPSDFGEVKKSSSFYSKICDLIGVAPENIAHIGDHEKFDYQVPQKIGIRSFYLDRSRKTKGEHVVYSLVEFERLLSRMKRTL